MEGAEWSLKKFFLLTVYDLRYQCHEIYNVMEKIFFLTDGMAEWQTRLASMPNLVQESGFDSRVDQVANGPPLLRR